MKRVLWTRIVCVLLGTQEHVLIVSVAEHALSFEEFEVGMRFDEASGVDRSSISSSRYEGICFSVLC